MKLLLILSTSLITTIMFAAAGTTTTPTSAAPSANDIKGASVLGKSAVSEATSSPESGT